MIYTRQLNYPLLFNVIMKLCKSLDNSAKIKNSSNMHMVTSHSVWSHVIRLISRTE